MITETPIQKLQLILDQLDLSKYASLSEMLNTVFESGEKFAEFINNLNDHIAQEEIVTLKLNTLQELINSLPKEEEIKEVIPFEKLDEIVTIVEKHAVLVDENNNKALQLEILIKTITEAYNKLKRDADLVTEFMTNFKNSPIYLTRYDNDKPAFNLVDMDSSFNCKVNTEITYAAGDYIKYVELNDDIKPMVFYTPTEFVRGYVKTSDIVLEKGMQEFYLFSGNPITYDVSMVNSLLPEEDTEAEISMYENVTFEIEIWTHDKEEPVTTSFSYYGEALGVTFYSGCRFRVKYVQNGVGLSPFTFPKFRKMVFKYVPPPKLIHL
jgi:hypothetical protein